jgi:DNA-binding PadR family transcriptional regulator
MSRRLPSLTHLQFIVLGALLGNERRGRDLRRELARHGVRRSAPAFYQMMARLEDAGWVDGSYTQEIVDGQIIKERGYRITSAGQRAWTATRDFYAETADRFGRQAGVAHA